MRVATLAGAALAVGFLLMELAVPRFGPCCRLNANESTAIATLKNLSSAQSQLQASGALDCDEDGTGEYGFFAELAGAVPMRATRGPRAGARLEPPVMSRAFGTVVHGCVRRSGYVFQLCLRSVDGGWVPEAPCGGGIDASVDVDRAEREWICYAWPIEHGRTGRRAFVITHGGDVLACNMASELYSGRFGPPLGVAAFTVGAAGWTLAVNTTDLRGNVWVVVS